MTVSSFIGVLGTLGLVLGLLLVTLRLLKRLSVTTATGLAPLPLRVEQRLAVGPRQGIAIVRIGTRVVAVSTGEGGVRRIADVTDDAEALNPTTETDGSEPINTMGAGDPTAPTGFGNILRTAIKRSLPLVFALACALPSMGAQATKAPATAPATAPAKAAAKAATKTATKAPAGKGTAKPATPVAQTPVQPTAGRADTMITKLAPKIDLRVGGDNASGLRLSGTVGVIVLMGLLTLLPTLILMMTGFTRIMIVLSFLKQAIGAQSAPPTQLVAGLAMLLTGFVMAPTLTEVNKTALEPWMDGKIEQAQMLSEGVKPFRAFMLRQVRSADLATYMKISRQAPVATVQDVPLIVLTSAFVTSELRTSFQIGFALFLPFIVIDIVVAAVLMSMGMMMVPPAMIALPFKLLLFVLVDGWSLVIQGLVQSFN
jgi:flagellar biosynthesis protein FliP